FSPARARTASSRAGPAGRTSARSATRRGPRARPRPARARRRGRSGGASLLAERPELVRAERERHHARDRHRLPGDLPGVERDQGAQQAEVEAEAAERDEEEAKALVVEVAAAVPERPLPVPEVVVRDGDDERARRRWEVVEPRTLEQGDVYREVDQVAARPDDAELRQLDPVLRPQQRLTRSRGCDARCRRSRHAARVAERTASGSRSPRLRPARAVRPESLPRALRAARDGTTRRSHRRRRAALRARPRRYRQRCCGPSRRRPATWRGR